MSVTLHLKLKRVETLTPTPTEQELLELPFDVKQQIYLALFESIGIWTLRDVISVRSKDRANEKRDGKTLEQRKMSENTFQRVFLKVVAKEMLMTLKWADTPTPEALQTRKEENYRAMEFLLSEIKKKTNFSSPPVSPTAADLEKDNSQSYISLAAAKAMVTGKSVSAKPQTSSTPVKSRFTSPMRRDENVKRTIKNPSPFLNAAAQQQINPTLSENSSTPSSIDANVSQITSGQKPPKIRSVSNPKRQNSNPNISNLTTANMSDFNSSNSSAKIIPLEFQTNNSESSNISDVNFESIKNSKFQIGGLEIHNDPSPRYGEEFSTALDSTNSPMTRSFTPEPKEEKAFKELRKQHQSLKLLYDQLLTEKNSEKIDERRVRVLKAQNFQLERQVLILNENVKSRMWAVQDISNAMNEIFSLKDVSPELLNWAKGVQTKLQQVHNSSSDIGNHPFFVPGESFSPRNGNQTVKVVDICNGNAIKNPAILDSAKLWGLEERLAKIHRQLLSLESSMHTIISPHLQTPLKEHVADQINNLCQTISDAVCDLTDLGVLLPQYKNPQKKNNQSTSYNSVDEILSGLPPIKTNKEKVEQYIQTVFQTQLSRTEALSVEVEILRKEQSLYRQCNAIGTEYVAKLIKTLRDTHKQLENDVLDRITEPLSICLGGLRAYEQTPQDGSALALLVSMLKQQSPILQSILDASENIMQKNSRTTPASRNSTLLELDHKKFLEEIHSLILNNKQEYDGLLRAKIEKFSERGEFIETKD